MAKAGVTYIDATQFEAILIAHASALTLVPQAGFIKVQAKNGHRMYIARTKKVGRVDLAFKIEGPGFFVPAEKSGAIELGLDFSLPEEDILANFAGALETMESLAPVVKVAAAKKVAGQKATSVGWSPEVLKSTKTVTAADDKGLGLALGMSLAAKGKPLAATLIARLNDNQRKQYDAKWNAPTVAPQLAMAADKA